MNLVIDDAVEVQLAMKGGKEEKRRQLGIITSSDVKRLTLTLPRTNPTERRQRFTDSSLAIRELRTREEDLRHMVRSSINGEPLGGEGDMASAMSAGKRSQSRAPVIT